MVALGDGGEGGLDFAGDLANPGPAGCGQHQDRDAAPPQALLVAEVGIDGDQELVARLLRQANQIPICNGGPAQLIGRGHDMAVQATAQGNRRSLVKQHPHSGDGSCRTEGGMLQDQASLLRCDPGEELHKFSQGDPVFQVFEQSRHWDPGAAEHPGIADPLGIPLHRGAASPAEVGLCAHGHIVAGLVQGRQLDSS